MSRFRIYDQVTYNGKHCIILTRNGDKGGITVKVNDKNAPDNGKTLKVYPEDITHTEND